MRRRGREIPRLENLDKLQGLRWLDLGQNRIPRLENLSLPKLEVLDLSANQISAIPELRLPTLQRLLSATLAWMDRGTFGMNHGENCFLRVQATRPEWRTHAKHVHHSIALLFAPSKEIVLFPDTLRIGPPRGGHDRRQIKCYHR